MPSTLSRHHMTNFELVLVDFFANLQETFACKFLSGSPTKPIAKTIRIRLNSFKKTETVTIKSISNIFKTTS